MTVIELMSDGFRIHARIQRLKAFSELRALAHVLDVLDNAGVSTSKIPKLKCVEIHSYTEAKR